MYSYICTHVYDMEKTLEVIAFGLFKNGKKRGYFYYLTRERLERSVEFTTLSILLHKSNTKIKKTWSCRPNVVERGGDSFYWGDRVASRDNQFCTKLVAIRVFLRVVREDKKKKKKKPHATRPGLAWWFYFEKTFHNILFPEPYVRRTCTRHISLPLYIVAVDLYIM